MEAILINLLNPIVHFWLHHIAHCTEKMSQHACAQVLVEQKGWDREVGGVTHTVTCTWCLLDLAVKGSWLEPGGPPLSLTAWRGLGNTTPHFAWVWFLARNAAWALSGCITTESADPEHETCLALGSWLHQNKLSPQA